MNISKTHLLFYGGVWLYMGMLTCGSQSLFNTPETDHVNVASLVHDVRWVQYFDALQKYCAQLKMRQAKCKKIMNSFPWKKYSCERALLENCDFYCFLLRLPSVDIEFPTKWPFCDCGQTTFFGQVLKCVEWLLLKSFRTEPF